MRPARAARLDGLEEQAQGLAAVVEELELRAEARLV